MKRVKRLSMLLLSIVLSASLVQPAAADEEKVVSIYVSKDAWRSECITAAQVIEEKYGIKADVVTLPTDEMISIISTKLATNDPPDIFIDNAPQFVAQYNATQTCEVLDDEPWAARLANPGLMTYKGDGHIYAMPTYAPGSMFGGIYYNKEMMKELGYEDPHPKTMEEFWAMLEDIKSQGVTPLYRTDADRWTTQIWTTMGWAVAVSDQGDAIYDELLTNKRKFAEVPEFVEILQEMSDLYTKGYANENHASKTYETAMAALGEGEYPMMIAIEPFETAMHEQYPDVELGAFLIPFADKELLATGAATSGLFVPKGEHSDLAKEYLNYWSSPEVMEEVYKSTPGPSAFVDVEGASMLPAQGYLVENYINTGKYVYEFNSHFDGITIMDQYLTSGVVEVTMGKDPVEVLEQWDEAFESFMRDKEIEGFE